VGCYSSSLLKQNLVPRFLSIVLEWCRDYVRVRLQRLLFQFSDDTLSCVEDLNFAEDVVHLDLLKLAAEELTLPKVSCQNLVETLLRLVGSNYLVCMKRSYRS
jgi:hypothetical protein